MSATVIHREPAATATGPPLITLEGVKNVYRTGKVEYAARSAESTVRGVAATSMFSTPGTEPDATRTTSTRWWCKSRIPRTIAFSRRAHTYIRVLGGRQLQG